jgi:hypothetical protein
MADDQTTANRDEAPRNGLYANEPRRDMAELRTLKVKLPIAQHIQLHSMRVYRGDGISETVIAALQLYFESMRTPEPLPGPSRLGELAG